jgi:hypothetical protein
MKGIFIIFLMLAISIAGGTDKFSNDWPSSVIQTEGLPGVKLLSGTTTDSLIKISEMNPELVKEPRWIMPDIGYATSEKVSVRQTDNETLTLAQQIFSTNAIPELPASIGNASPTKEIFNISENNTGGLVYL